MNKTRRRAVQKHRAKGLKFEQRRKLEAGGGTAPRPRQQPAQPGPRRRETAREEPAPAAEATVE